jgi:hypothetical protein
MYYYSLLKCEAPLTREVHLMRGVVGALLHNVQTIIEFNDAGVLVPAGFVLLLYLRVLFCSYTFSLLICCVVVPGVFVLVLYLHFFDLKSVT